MKSTKIKEADIESLKVSALPTRPTAPAAFGGKGYTPAELKAAFDALPLYIIEKFNSLIEDITASADSGIMSEMRTGITEGHTLANMLSDIKSGDFVSYVKINDTTLGEYLAALRSDVDSLASKIK